jgi:hypothetical protein
MLLKTTNTCKQTVCSSHDNFKDVFDSPFFQTAKPFAPKQTLVQTLRFQLPVGMALVKFVCIVFLLALVACLTFISPASQFDFL